MQLMRMIHFHGISGCAGASLMTSLELTDTGKLYTKLISIRSAPQYSESLGDAIIGRRDMCCPQNGAADGRVCVCVCGVCYRVRGGSKCVYMEHRVVRLPLSLGAEGVCASRRQKWKLAPRARERNESNHESESNQMREARVAWAYTFPERHTSFLSCPTCVLLRVADVVTLSQSPCRWSATTQALLTVAPKRLLSQYNTRDGLLHGNSPPTRRRDTRDTRTWGPLCDLHHNLSESEQITCTAAYDPPS
ncbi:hypothetical protein DL93DRAFT_794873 [Clavulina sp. PMI_390]|nr:hypothetical protein DL93DRAFT_794873 [Clavulina sp. PMI_390]